MQKITFLWFFLNSVVGRNFKTPTKIRASIIFWFWMANILKRPYLGQYATNLNTEGTFFSPTFKVRESKVPLFFWLFASWLRYGRFPENGTECSEFEAVHRSLSKPVKIRLFGRPSFPLFDTELESSEKLDAKKLGEMRWKCWMQEILR